MYPDVHVHQNKDQKAHTSFNVGGGSTSDAPDIVEKRSIADTDQSGSAFDEEPDITEQDVLYDDALADMKSDGGRKEEEEHSMTGRSLDSETTTANSGGERRRTRHRMRQLKRIRRNQAIRHTVSALKYITMISTIVLAAGLTVLFGISRNLIVTLQNQLQLVTSAGERATMLQGLPLMARTMQLASAWNDSTSFDIAVAGMQHFASRASDLHEGLFLGFGSVTAVDDVALNAHYRTDAIDARVYVETAEPPTNTIKTTNFWDFANVAITAAFLITGPEPASTAVLPIMSQNASTPSPSPGYVIVGGSTSSSSSSPVSSSSLNDLLGLSVPTGTTLLPGYSVRSDGQLSSPWAPNGNGTVRDTSVWRFLMDNAGLLHGHACASADIELEYVVNHVAGVHTFQIVVFVLQVMLPLIMLCTVIRPLYQRLLTERSSMFGLFGVIPRKLTRDLSTMVVRLGNSRDQQSSDSNSSGSELEASDDDNEEQDLSVNVSAAVLEAIQNAADSEPGSPVTLVGDGDISKHFPGLNNPQAAPHAPVHAEIPGYPQKSISNPGASLNSGRLSLAETGKKTSASSMGQYSDTGRRTYTNASDATSVSSTSRRLPRRKSNPVVRFFKSIFSAVFFYLRLFFFLIYKVGDVALQLVLPLLSLKRPVTMPRRVGYGVLAVMVLSGLNYAISTYHLRAAEISMHHLHFGERRASNIMRILHLTQELVFAQSPLVLQQAPQPPPADSLSSTPDVNALRAAIRAMVTETQRVHDVVVLGSDFTSDLPGMGEGFLSLADMEAANLTSLSVFSSLESLGVYTRYNATGSSSSLSEDHINPLLTSLMISQHDLDSLPIGTGDGMSGNDGSIYTSLEVRNLLFAPTCLRNSGTGVGARTSKLFASAYTAWAKSRSSVDIESTLTTSWTNSSASTLPVLPPSNPLKCLSAYSRYGPYARNGLDVALRTVLDRAWMLANESLVDLGPWNSKYILLHELARADVADGLQKLRDLHVVAVSRALGIIHLSESLLYIFFLVITLGWYFALLRPFVTAVGLETSRVAALLSFLPKSVDLQKLMRLHQLATLRSKESEKTAVSRLKSDFGHA
jgi:hypothetical protein